jgi:hypothetical protein
MCTQRKRGRHMQRCKYYCTGSRLHNSKQKLHEAADAGPMYTPCVSNSVMRCMCTRTRI